MTTAQNALPIAALLLIAVPGFPAAAQAAHSAAPAPPPAWSVTPDETRGAVTIAATSRDGAVKFVGGCSKGAAPGLTGAFSGYRGGGLLTDGQVEHVAFYARGEDWQDAFSVRLRYSAANRSWEFARPLAPVFLSSFSRGAVLAVVNAHNEEVFSFDLTGTTAAVRAMRTICGLPAE
jgi:hypothetical protein